MKKRSNNKTNGQAKDNRWATVLSICGVAIFAPAGIVLAWKLSDAVTVEDARLLVGAMVTMVIFFVVTVGLSLFIANYSKLRRMEEDEDDRREMDLMKIMLGQQAGTKYNYTIRQPPIPQVPPGMTYQLPQQSAEAPPEIQYVENGDVTLGG